MRRVPGLPPRQGSSQGAAPVSIPGEGQIWIVEHANGFITVRAVERRLMRAMKTVRALPDREHRFQRGGQPNRCNIAVVQEYMDAYGREEEHGPPFRPTAADVSDMLTALDWLRGLEKNECKLLWWRSFEVSFRVIAARLGRSDETARTRYRDALLKAWYNAQKNEA